MMILVNKKLYKEIEKTRTEFQKLVLRVTLRRDRALEDEDIKEQYLKEQMEGEAQSDFLRGN